MKKEDCRLLVRNKCLIY
jgi:hypothetical protein